MLKKTSRTVLKDRTAEGRRLADDTTGQQKWKHWGPYLSERQWGTVREDYSPDGSAWEYFPHDHARSRAYRWGEDGIAGISDSQQRLCMAPALWNGRDPILKERFFGLTNHEGNHGEDVKEIYYHLDATPTHSYLKMLYKYPQRGFPYAQLIEENRRRGRDQPEFEVIDTGIFDDDRYWDVFVEYARAEPDDILMRITLENRGPEEATIHVLPQIWFRNDWSWIPGSTRPLLVAGENDSIVARHSGLGEYRLVFDAGNLPRGERPELLFCDNDTNVRRLFGLPDAAGFFKDAFHEYVVNGNKASVNPNQSGTKAAAHYVITVPAQQSREIRLRLAKVGPASNLSGQGENLNSNGRRQTARQAGSLSQFPDFDRIARGLMEKSRFLSILVPYRETCDGMPLDEHSGGHHVRTLDEFSFDFFEGEGIARRIGWSVFLCQGAWGGRDWTPFRVRRSRWMNRIRTFLGMKPRSIPLQMLIEFESLR